LTPTDINAVIREATDLMDSEAHHAGVVVHFDLAADIAWARADTIQVQQIIINLVRNAIEAMVIESLGPRELHIRTRAITDEEIEISVRDTGPGVPEEIRDLMFDPFFTTKSDGMGMGLAICRSIIERHGGNIYFGSQEGPGTDIRFTLRAQLPGLAGTRDFPARARRDDGEDRSRYN
jgi:signal transduction histidine kinase